MSTWTDFAALPWSIKVAHSLVLVAMAILQMDQEAGSRLWATRCPKESGARSSVLYPSWIACRQKTGWTTIGRA